MVDPQENITIGNFLYALGLGVGARAGSAAPVGAVNLLQQTSYDGLLGDVMLTFPGVTRLLEFKRKGNHKKETTKLDLLREAIKASPHWPTTSRQVHWYVETAPASAEFKFEAKPYLDMFDRDAASLPLKSFVDSLVDEALGSKPAVSDQLVNEYIQDVMLTWRANGDHRSATGLLVTVGGDGGLMYAVLDDLADLGKTRMQCLQLQQQRELVVAQILKDAARQRHMAQRQDRGLPTAEKSLEHKLVRSKGMGR